MEILQILRCSLPENNNVRENPHFLCYLQAQPPEFSYKAALVHLAMLLVSSGM